MRQKRKREVIYGRRLKEEGRLKSRRKKREKKKKKKELKKEGREVSLERDYRQR